MDNTELAYLAGFFDGEGSISIIKTKAGHSLVLSVSQLNPEPLVLFQRHFGGSLHRQPDRRGNRAMIVWTTAARRALLALVELRPLLLVKADEADLGIEFQGERDDWTDRVVEIARRDDLRMRIKAMKQRTYDHIELPPTVRQPRLSSPRHLVTKTWAKPKPPKRQRVKIATPVRSTHREGRPRAGEIIHPSREDLVQVYANLGIVETARHYGVSRQSIYNWLDRYEIPRTGRTEASEARRVAALQGVWREPMGETKTEREAVKESNDRQYAEDKLPADAEAAAAVKKSNDRQYVEEKEGHP
jgi:hypothetical protein